MSRRLVAIPAVVSTLLAALLVASLSIVSLAHAGAAFSSTTAWKWVYSSLGTTPTTTQGVEANVSGNTDAHKNAGFVLRSSGSKFAIANFSGTKYQIFLVDGTSTTLAFEKSIVMTAAGKARAEVSGTTVTAWFNGTLVSTNSVPALANYAGTGVGLAIWQDRASSVIMSDGTIAPPSGSGSGPATSTSAPVASAPTTAPATTTFKTAAAWSWVYQNTANTASSTQQAQATISGVSDVDKNGGVVLRRSADKFLMVTSAQGRVRLWTVVSGRMTLVKEATRPVGSSGTLTAAVTGNTVTAAWNGATAFTYQSTALDTFTGTGTGLSIWQNVANAVTVSTSVAAAPSEPTTSAPAPTTSVAPAPTTAAPVPTTSAPAPSASAPAPAPSPTTSNGTWLSGASGDGAANGTFGNWRGTKSTIGGTWNDTYDGQINQYAVQPGFEWGAWQGDLDVAVGAIFTARGETWAAAANGAYDARWRAALGKLKSGWGARTGTLHIRFAHEFNGDWIPWKVRGTDAADFVATWKRFRALQKEILPRHLLVWCPNDGTSSSLGLDVRKAFPGAAYVDEMGVDSYNNWPWVNTSTDFAAKILRVDSYGAPVGLERHRQFAASHGLPLAIPEWSNASDVGDAPNYITEFYNWVKKNAGTGPGQISYEILFNVGGFGGGVYQLYPATKMPQSAARYAATF